MAYLVETQGLHGPVRVLIREDGLRMVMTDEDVFPVSQFLQFEDDDIPNPEFLEAFDHWRAERGYSHERRVTHRSPLWIDWKD